MDSNSYRTALSLLREIQSCGYVFEDADLCQRVTAFLDAAPDVDHPSDAVGSAAAPVAAPLYGPNDSRWIPVEESLPNDRDSVLVIEYGRLGLYRFCIPENLKPSRGITHWMPAPSIPATGRSQE